MWSCNKDKEANHIPIEFERLLVLKKSHGLSNKSNFIKFFKNIGHYFGNHVREFLLVSISFNMITAFIKFYFGITIPSYLFGFNAGYYICLCIARIMLLKKLKKINNKSEFTEAEKNKVEIQAYEKIGFFTILMAVMYFVSCLQLYFYDEEVIYAGFLVYYVALVAFTKLGMAIYGTWVNRRLHKPIIAALKQLSFADALVSIVVTECTLLVMTGNYKANLWSSYLGIMVSGVIFLQGIMMVYKSHKYMQIED